MRSRGALHREPKERADRRPFLRLGGVGRVWVLNVALVAVTAAVFALLVQPLLPVQAPVRFPWWVLAIGFAVAETFVVHLPLRREAHSFSLSDIPLVLGLYFVSPEGLVLAQIVGAAAALLIRRQSPLKLVFNLAHFALEACLAVVVFRLVASGDPIGFAGLMGAFLATGVTTLVGAIAVTVAISLSEGRMQLQTMFQGLGFGAVVTAANTCLALIAAEIIWRDPSVAWLLAVPAVLLFFGFRLYTSQRQKHQTLEALYGSTRHLQRSLHLESTTRVLLDEARKMFRADVGEVTLFPAGPGEHATRIIMGPGEDAERSEPVELDPVEGVWARVAAEDRGLLLARPIESAKIRSHFEARGIRDAMVVPLHADDRVTGTLMVANRMGDVTTFDEEDLRLLETLGNQASVAFENARLVSRLEDSLAHLTEMNRLKDDFVATVSHELRTPLTSIQGSVKTLLRLDLTEEDRKEMLVAADRGGERLRTLIEDLLMVSRIESGGIRPALGAVRVHELVRTVVEDLPQRVRARLELDLPEIPAVETDERKVTQIVANLVDNAMKYSSEGSAVRVGVGPELDGVRIRVENTGEPIPEDHRDSIFDRFVQVDQSTTRASTGTGLGLYICRKLAETIGGRVWLERSDDTATVFALFVPGTPPIPAEPGEYSPVRLPTP